MTVFMYLRLLMVLMHLLRAHLCRYSKFQQDRLVTQTVLSLFLLKLEERGSRRESKEGKELRKSGSLTAVLVKLLWQFPIFLSLWLHKNERRSRRERAECHEHTPTLFCTMLTQHPRCQRALFYLFLSIVPNPPGDMNHHRAAVRLAVDNVLWFLPHLYSTDQSRYETIKKFLWHSKLPQKFSTVMFGQTKWQMLSPTWP